MESNADGGGRAMRPITRQRSQISVKGTARILRREKLFSLLILLTVAAPAKTKTIAPVVSLTAESARLPIAPAVPSLSSSESLCDELYAAASSR